jgi:Fe-S cluster assembly protein SufD
MTSLNAASSTPESLASVKWEAASKLGIDHSVFAVGSVVPVFVQPTTQGEVWRYSRVDKLQIAGLPLVSGANQVIDLALVSAHDVAEVGVVAARVVVVDGSVRSIWVDDSAAAAGLSIRSAAYPDDAYRLATSLSYLHVDGGDSVADVSQACACDALVISVSAGKAIPGVVHITNEVRSSGSVVASRVRIETGANSEVSVIERVVGEAPGSVFLPITELVAGAGSTLRFVTVQELGESCTQIAHQQCTTGRDATLRAMAVALGGSYARVRCDAVITDQGGFNELLAVYFGAGSQMHDFRTMQHHIAQRTSSDLLFKGAVAGSSQSVYSGLIRIGVDARQTVANQANRNLLLSPTATAESVPNLEIENNDVKCSHASAVGPVDDEHRYYLESRGVPPHVAEELIVVGFFADVLMRSPIPGLVDLLSPVFIEKFAKEKLAKEIAA